MNIETSFTAMSDEVWRERAIRSMVPTTRPDYSSHNLLREVMSMNGHLLQQLDEMRHRIERLEQYQESNRAGD